MDIGFRIWRLVDGLSRESDKVILDGEIIFNIPGVGFNILYY